MQGRATCGINRCELITQLHQRKLCHHSDKNLKIRFPPVPQLPIAFSFLPLKKVCSGVIGVFYWFFSGRTEEGRPFFLQIHTEPPREAQSRKQRGCSTTAQPLAPAKTQGAPQLEQNLSCLSRAMVISTGSQTGRVGGSLFPRAFQT